MNQYTIDSEYSCLIYSSQNYKTSPIKRMKRSLIRSVAQIHIRKRLFRIKTTDQSARSMFGIRLNHILNTILNREIKNPINLIYIIFSIELSGKTNMIQKFCILYRPQRLSDQENDMNLTIKTISFPSFPSDLILS